jgi:predicted GIY-YIG superfamily endonuclease
VKREEVESWDGTLKAEEVAVPTLTKQPSHDWFVYILRTADGTLYTGITNDLERRVEQHNAGTASRYTRSRLPVKLEYRERQETKGAALKRELAIKALSREAKEALIRSSPLQAIVRGQVLA